MTQSLHEEVKSFRGGVLGYTVFKRTYAAPLTEKQKNHEEENGNEVLETFVQCIQRMLDSDLIAKHCQFSEEDLTLLRNFLMQQKCSLSGRCLQSLGVAQNTQVKEHGFMPLCSCAFTTVSEPVRPFIYTAKLSLLGVGVGYSIQHEHVDKLPVVKKIQVERMDKSTADFIVPDTRQGWIRLFEVLLSAYFGGASEYGTNQDEPSCRSGCTFSYSFQLLEKSGSVQNIMGLEDAVKNVASVLGSRAGRKARPVDCMDTMNIIASCIVLGKTRRAALLAIGDATDQEFLCSKRWDLGPLPPWRSASNNSVVCSDVSELPPEFWEGYKGNGEAMGLVNLDLFRTCGRVGEFQHPDPMVMGVSACAEQGLGHEEVSCLAELMLPHFDSPHELWEATRLIYAVCKNTFLLDSANFPKTVDTVRDNFRMGIGVTGYMQASEKQKSWLADNYEKLRAYDQVYSKKRNLPPSIKLTTVKPSGTVSLLSGTTPGCHPGFSPYYVRRIRFNADSPLLGKCQKMGLYIEDELGFDGKPSSSGHKVVEFPCRLPPGTHLAEETSAIQQLEVVRRLQKEWSDSAVSVTVYYKQDELKNIQEWLAQHYTTSIKACSFMLHNDHGFVQAPYEKIHQEKFHQISQSTFFA